MSTTKLRLFLYSNELTKCLYLIERTKENPTLFREVLANIKKHKMQKEKCIFDLMKICRNCLYKTSSEDLCAFRMLLAIYSVFPEAADISFIEILFRLKIEDRTVVLLLLKIGISLITCEATVKIMPFVERYLEKLVFTDTELDYLFLTLICKMAEKKKIEHAYIEVLRQKAPVSPPKVLISKLILLSIYTDFIFKVPCDALSTDNVSLYLRVMDSLMQVGVYCTKEKLLNLMPVSEDKFAPLFSSFLIKEVVLPDFERSSIPKHHLFTPSPLHRIRRLVESARPPIEIIDKIKSFLDAEEESHKK